MRKLLFLYIVFIFPSHYVFGNRLEYLESIAEEIHKLAEECPRIAYAEVDDIFDTFFEATMDLTNSEIRAIFQSKKDNMLPFQKANTLGFEHKSDSCEYIANRIKTISNISYALIQLGKGDMKVGDTNSNDLELAKDFLQKKTESERSTKIKQDAQSRRSHFKKKLKKQMRKL